MEIDHLNLSGNRPILIAGPTASGKSALALALAEKFGATIANADALQVYGCWDVLTARPSKRDLARAQHALYGHVAFDQPYSVGNWLDEIRTLMKSGGPLIVVGGTGLYFRALTEGLADIPQTPPEVKNMSDNMSCEEMISELDPETLAALDIQNPRRVARAWEVQRATGRGLAAWHWATPPPVMPLVSVDAILLSSGPDWLNPRIEKRFAQMIDIGALAEVRAMLDRWDPALQSSKAIGAPEIIAYLRAECSLEQAIEQAIISTRQYAKRQRTWFRARMKDWVHLEASKLAG